MNRSEATNIVPRAEKGLVQNTLMTKWVKFTADITDTLPEADKMYFFSAEKQMIFNIEALTPVP